MDTELEINEIKNTIDELRDIEASEIYETIQEALSTYSNLQKPI